MSNNLSNKEFRALLSAADSHAVADAQKKVSGGGSAKERRRSRYLDIRKRRDQAQQARERRKDQHGSKESHGDSDDESSSKPARQNQYRDRAAERREQEKLRSKGAPLAPGIETLPDVTEEESKALGGDVNHTHLVRGLDYILLNKIRSELEEKEKKQETPEPPPPLATIPDPDSARPPVDAAVSAMARRVCAELSSGLHPHQVNFQKTLDHIDATLLRGARFRDNERSPFASGRMLYQFDLTNPTSVPMLIFQSSEEAKDRIGRVAPVHWRLARHLADVLPKTKKRAEQEQSQTVVPPHLQYRQFQDHVAQFKPFSAVDVDRWKPVLPDQQQQAAAATAAEDDDEDIFAGVGSFNPADVIAEAAAAPAAPEAGPSETPQVPLDEDAPAAAVVLPSELKKHAYFDEAPEEEVQEEDTEGVSGFMATVLAANKTGALAAQAARRRIVQDNDAADYGECYPELGGFSDDDGERRRRRRRGRGGADSDDDDAKKPRLTGRAARRQAERQWKKLEGYLETKSYRNLDSLEQHIASKSGGGSGSSHLFDIL